MKMNTLFSGSKLVFLTGFLLGINFAFIHSFLRQFSNIYKPCCMEQNEKIKSKSIGFNISKRETYEKWLNKQGVSHWKMNMDFYLHGPKFNRSNEKNLESEWLKNKVHVTCVVFIEKAKKIESIQNTWGPRCNKLYFFAKNNKKQKQLFNSTIHFNLRMESSWHHLCETFNYIWQNENETQKLNWIIFVNDETMIIPENLRFLVAPLNYNEDYYLGHPITMWKQKYNVAQAGYVLSRKTLQKLTTKFNSSDKCASTGKYWKMEDYYLGQHLQALDIHPSDTRDSKLRGIFHGYSLQTLMWGIARPTNYWTKALFPIGTNGCCSPLSITFTISETDKLYTMNYLLYHLHVHTNIGIYGNAFAPTPLPENEVWKVVLKEEFGLNNVLEMTNEQYYNIWRSIYSEPEEFIARNFKTKSPSLDKKVFNSFV